MRELKPSKSLLNAHRKWVGKKIKCYVRSSPGDNLGPFTGTVKGISDNQADVEREGGEVYDATGLLVDIPELGRNQTYREWPVWFDDAEIADEA